MHIQPFPPTTLTETLGSGIATEDSYTTWTNTLNIGAASEQRYVVIGLAVNGNGSSVQCLSATIAGITCKLLERKSDVNIGQTELAFFGAWVPASYGTTASVSITMANSFNRASIYTWALYGLWTDNVRDFQFGSVNQTTFTVNALDRSVVLMTSFRGGTGSVTVTGLNIDFTGNTDGRSYFCSSLMTTDQLPYTVTCNFGGDDCYVALIVLR